MISVKMLTLVLVHVYRVMVVKYTYYCATNVVKTGQVFWAVNVKNNFLALNLAHLRLNFWGRGQ